MYVCSVDIYIHGIYTVYMTTKVIFNVDAKMKAKAMANAKKQGVTLSYFLNQALFEIANGERRVEVVEQVNAKTLRGIKKALADAKAGRHTSPTFTNAHDALRWLHSK